MGRGAQGDAYGRAAGPHAPASAFGRGLDGADELLQSVVLEPDPHAAVSAALERVAALDGACQLLCLRSDHPRRLLVPVAEHGVSPAQTEQFAIELEDDAHPLVVALRETRPIVLAPADRERRQPEVPLDEGPLHVVPLTVADLDEAVGLLVCRSGRPQVQQDIHLIARLLGTRLLGTEAADLREHNRHLQRQHDLLRSAVDAVTDPVLVVDRDSQILLAANERAERLFEADATQSEGRRRAVSMNTMIFSAASSPAAHSRDPSARELPLVDPVDGKDLLFELLAKRISGPAGDGAVSVSVLRDVRDLRDAAEEMRANYARLREAESVARAERDRFQLIINALADPVLVTAPDGHVELMNPPAERLFVKPEGSDSRVARRVASNDAMLSSFVSNVFTAEASKWRGELSLLEPDNGDSIPFAAVCGKVHNQQRDVSAVVTVLHDRSEAVEKAQLYAQVKRQSERLEEKVQEATAELVQRNELLQRQAMELEQASRLKSQFLANMSHELRTPLHAILGYTQLLLEEALGPLDSAQHKRLARVESNARHLLSIINDILDIAGIEAGRMPIQLAEVDLGALVREVMDEMEPLVARSSVSVGLDMADDIPVLHSDRQKIKQITMNLLSNALKFTSEGSVAIEVSWDREVDQVRVVVEDTGIGISEEDQQLIFQDFQQADSSSTRRYGGTGLGLSISRRLAEALGGWLTLRSTVGEGSRFTLHLPRRVDTEAAS